MVGTVPRVHEHPDPPAVGPGAAGLRRRPVAGHADPAAARDLRPRAAPAARETGPAGSPRAAAPQRRGRSQRESGASSPDSAPVPAKEGASEPDQCPPDGRRTPVRPLRLSTARTAGSTYSIISSPRPAAPAWTSGPAKGTPVPSRRRTGLHVCQSCESCLDTRRITLDSGRDLRVYFHPRGGWQGRGKNRRRAGTVTIMRAGSLEPGWYHELAQQAEAADGLTASRPHDWLECKRTRECATNENGHHWAFEDDEGTTIKHPDGRHVLHWDSDNLAADGAVQRNCSHCHETQMKRPDGQWSGDRDGCPCCEELPAGARAVLLQTVQSRRPAVARNPARARLLLRSRPGGRRRKHHHERAGRPAQGHEASYPHDASLRAHATGTIGVP